MPQLNKILNFSVLYVTILYMKTVKISSFHCQTGNTFSLTYRIVKIPTVNIFDYSYRVEY